MPTIEGPSAIYERAKNTFIKSLIDGIDLGNATVKYHLALKNLRRHNGYHIWTDADYICSITADSILKQSDGDSGWGHEYQDAPAEEGGEAKPLFEGQVPWSAEAMRIEGLGGSKPHDGWIQSSEPTAQAMHGSWPTLKPEDHPSVTEDMRLNRLYPNHNPYGPTTHPLLDGMAYEERKPAFIKNLYEYFIPKNPGDASKAEIDESREMQHEKYLMKRLEQ